MKEILTITLDVLFIVGTIVFVLATIMATISLAEPWFWFLDERYNEWVEEIQKGLNQRREKKKRIKEKLKELIDESNISNRHCR